MGETEVVHTEKNNMTLAFGRFTQTYREREREMSKWQSACSFC